MVLFIQFLARALLATSHCSGKLEKEMITEGTEYEEWPHVVITQSGHTKLDLRELELLEKSINPHTVVGSHAN